MPALPLLHQLFVLTELEDGIAHLSLFHFLEDLSLLTFHTAHLQSISLMLSTISMLISLETIPLTLLLFLHQLDLDQESSSIDEMDTQNTALIMDMNLLMSIIPLHTPTLSINSIGLLLDEFTLQFLAVLILFALQPFQSMEP